MAKKGSGRRQEPRPAEPMTEDQALGYLDAGGLACPYCAGRDVGSDGLDADGPVAVARAHCLACGREWQDVYRLVGVNEVNPAGDVVASFEEAAPGVLAEVRGGVCEVSTCGDVDVVVVDWDNVDEEINPETIRALLNDVEALPPGCDENGLTRAALAQRLDALTRDEDEDP